MKHLLVGIVVTATVAINSHAANSQSRPIHGSPAASFELSANEISSADREKLGALVRKETTPRLDKMIGQMIMVGFRGTRPDDKGVVAVREQLKRGQIGGVILFGINIKSRKQVTRLNRSLSKTGAKLPALIAVDQEGGHVQRLSDKNGFHYTNSHKKIAGKHDPKKAEAIYSKMAKTLAKAGFNVNFGPVVDIDLKGRRNPIIGRLNRSFSKDPKKVSVYARSFIAAHHRQHIMTSTKHFPGHGSSLADSHKGFTDITKTWDREKELAPYRDLAADMVMVGHLYHPDFSDARGRPATLSEKAVKKLLRNTVGAEVVAITDDMEMGAIRKGFKRDEAIIKAVKAGNDILLYSNTAKYSPRLGPRIHAVIKRAVREGRISEQQIYESYLRISKMKKKWLEAQK